MSPAVTDEDLQAVIDDLIKHKLAKPPPMTRATGARGRHPGRRAAKDERYVCVKEWACGICLSSLAETTSCHDAVIFYPPGVPKRGCGRIFSTLHGLTVVHPTMFSDTSKYPYGCLSDILPADERKVR
jgi:hypothetical protein